jgi:hypothetical protein
VRSFRHTSCHDGCIENIAAGHFSKGRLGEMTRLL